MQQVWIRKWEDMPISINDGQEHVTIILIEYEKRVKDATLINIIGITSAADKISISVKTDTQSITDTVAVSEVGYFSWTVELQTLKTMLPLHIVAKDEISGAQDKAYIVLQPRYSPNLPDPSILNFPKERLQYVAGSPDKFFYTRQFVRINPVTSLTTPIRAISTSGKILEVDQMKLKEILQNDEKNLRKKLQSGELSVQDYYNNLSREMAKQIPKTLVTPHEKMETNYKLIVQSKSTKLPKTSTEDGFLRQQRRVQAAQKAIGSGQIIDMGPVEVGNGFFTQEELEKMEEIIRSRYEYELAHQRIGVLFLHRLRIRPTQQIVGEPIYQIGLAPGEELQIQQKTETIQKVSFTEIHDQEEERTNTFSSTWTTELSSSLGNTNSNQRTTSIGGGIEADIPKVPIGVSATASESISDANNTSTEDAIKTSMEKTSTTTSKMRSQHKVQIEITTEDTSAFSSTRTLKNSNSLRTLHHTFYKIYRKEQISLERYNAQLCIRLDVLDPAEETRRHFLEGVKKIDPLNTSNYLVVKPPQDAMSRKTLTAIAPAHDAWITFEQKIDRWVTIEGDLRTLAGAKAQGRVLSEFEFKMTHLGLYFYNELVPIHGYPPRDREEVSDDELSGPSVKNLKIPDRFGTNGGKAHWLIRPDVVSGMTRFALQVNLPIFFSGIHRGAEREQEITHVKFEVESTWVVEGPVIQKYKEDMVDERRRVSRELTPDHIYRLQEIAEAEYSTSVIDRALSEQLDFPEGYDVVQLKEIFDLENIVIDSVPYWANVSVLNTYRETAAYLQALPTNLELYRILTDCLVASRAVVYLPVKENMEARALNLLGETRAVQEIIAKDIRDLREEHFGLTSKSDGGESSVLEPSFTLGTVAGSSAWQSDWEKSRESFQTLGQWSEIVPTDGVHLESHLGITSAADEQNVRNLNNQDELLNGGT